jgi:hypothetical protein
MKRNVEITESEILNIPNDSDLGFHVRSKYYEIQDQYDKCVLCGKLSPYLKTTHVELRVGYVESSGQGCFSPTTCSK